MSSGKHEIKIKIDFGDGNPKWLRIPYVLGDSIFVTNDPEQLEYHFAGFKYAGDSLIYVLTYMGDDIEVYAVETSDKPDILKKVTSNKNESDDE